MNDLEQECIILNSAWATIDGMVNWAMFVKHDRTMPTNMMFETAAHAQLFNILLGDFLSELRAFKGQEIPLGLRAAPSNTRPSNLTFLLHLRQVCSEPKLGGNISALADAVEDFAQWLEAEFDAAGVNFSDINVVADLRVSRLRYLKICGDIAKHNLARLSTNVAHIRRILEASGHPVNEHEGYLAIRGFYDWFHNDIFIYHSSVIAEFLNRIRWAIFDYLGPEYARSWHRPEGASIPELYAYAYPADCRDPMAQSMYWELMNRVRGRPWVHRFVVADSFKKNY